MHGEPGSRRWCCFLLGRCRELENLPLFLAVLHNPVPDVQKQALSSLRMLAQVTPLQQALPSSRPLLEHSDPGVQKAAQRTLEALGT